MPTAVMTGATSGIGLGAAKLLAKQGYRIIAGARSDNVPAGLEGRSLDLASLAAVSAFAQSVDEPIDVLVLNAGMQHYTVEPTSADGFVLTFAVNHLAHYLLARLLLERVRDGGRIVLTSSGTHDPEEKTQVPAPRHADAARLANPATDQQLSKSPVAAGLRAYSTSKLCNLMTARTLAGHPEVTARNITVHAYDPGFIPATGLGRKAPWAIRTFVMPFLSLMPPTKGMNRLSDGAKGLAGLADGSIDAPQVYMALRRGQPTWPEPSELARDDVACAKLWADSAAMVGLPA